MLALIVIALLMAGCAAKAPPPPPVIVQAPVPTPTPTPVANPYLALSPDVADAIRHNQAPTFHHGGTLVVPYSRDENLTVNCHPLYATQIRLAPGETTDANDVVLGDIERWSVTVGTGVVLVKPLRTDKVVISQGPQAEVHPAAPDLKTNLLISTDMGHYYNLWLTVNSHKPMTQAVEYYFPDETRTAYTAYQRGLKEAQHE